RLGADRDPRIGERRAYRRQVALADVHVERALEGEHPRPTGEYSQQVRTTRADAAEGVDEGGDRRVGVLRWLGDAALRRLGKDHVREPRRAASSVEQRHGDARDE